MLKLICEFITICCDFLIIYRPFRLAYGTENSLIIVDLIQKCVVFNVATSELYGQ